MPSHDSKGSVVCVRWLPSGFTGEGMDKLSHQPAPFGWDSDRNPVLLFASEWAARYFEQNNGELILSRVPPIKRSFDRHRLPVSTNPSLSQILKLLCSTPLA
ncbi:MAG: hypothetical protein CM1200mP29_10910 [Verrucomicrobiota bacterium]|nr:MAG: hypothetical protein CM1200mP29_10910 [Verrucomicrobiota bacterium]